MSEHEEKQLYTLAEFFELVGERRMELYEGTPVLMIPASYEHEGVVANLTSFRKKSPTSKRSESGR